MAKIYKTSDRLPISIHNINFKISPLTFAQRAEVQADLFAASKGDMAKATEASFKAVQYAVKEISGVESYDGTPYALTFADNILTDECVNDLLNLEIFPELTSVMTSLINGIPDKIVDAEGKEVKGITLLYQGKKRPNLRKPQK